MTIQGIDIEQAPSMLLYAKPCEIRSFKTEILLTALLELGFIGETCHQRSMDYLVGERFADLVTFLGCSPNIACSPEESEHYCYIRLLQPSSLPVLYSGKNTRPPRCARCAQVRNDWQDCESRDFCKQCDLSGRAENFRWRKQAALTQWVIEVKNIYPHEALPSSLLLDKLQNVSGVEWGYAYLHNS